MTKHRTVWARTLAVGLAILAFAPGCVRRTITLNTDPQTARVTLNDEYVGTSPITVPFTFYGDYDVILRKEGFQTLHTHHVIKRPWYQYPPVDLVAEALLPVEIRDDREMCFTLSPAEPVDREELVEKARDFRQRALFGEE